MNQYAKRSCALLLAGFLLHLCSPHQGFAQEKPEDHFATAKNLYASALDVSGDERIALFREIQQLLDLIVEQFPQSDLTLDILFMRPIDGLEVGIVNREIRQALMARNETLKPAARSSLSRSATQNRSDTPDVVASSQGEEEQGETANTPPASTENLAEQNPSDAPSLDVAILSPEAQALSNPTVSIPEANSETEGRLNLDRATIRKVQSRLTALGLDPRGVDGSIGPGTRGAIKGWQTANRFPSTGYLNEQQIDALRKMSEIQLTAWLRIPKNQRLFAPPAPVAITPARLAGAWSFSARCGANSRIPNQVITGVLSVRHAGGNQYSGTARNSQGLNGRFIGRLDGRVLHTEINWGLLFGRVQSSGRISDNARSLSGQDSNGCRVSATKR